jgi:protein-S-isoprenylcysteine O-methyltransferase Ste14
MTALLMVAYAFAAYGFFLLTFLYAVGFLANLPQLPTAIDAAAVLPWPQAVFVNLALLAVFAVQHSVMARPAFKRWWTRLVPEAIERSTYVLFATVALALVLAFWQPVAGPVIWQVDSPAGQLALWALFGLGWAVLLISTFLLNHFELFGLRQVVAQLLRRPVPAQEFRTPLFYRWVRHPLYVGFLIAFWATPRMTAGHLMFAAANTAYIFIGVWFEERDLIAQFGDRYRLYREQVGMLLPRARRTTRVR